MRSEWQPTSLDELIDIEHGFAFQGEFFRDAPPGDILLTPGNFAIGGGFKEDKFKYYQGPVPERFILEEGDLLITMTDLSKASDTLGFPAFVPNSIVGQRFLHNQRLGKVIIKPDAPLKKEFLYYLLCSDEYRNEVLASATGTTVKHTSPSRIKQFRFFRPSTDEQRAIGYILGTLDKKIVLNRRMTKTLEDISRSLFVSWFIDFTPVRAKAQGAEITVSSYLANFFPASLESTESGEIPTGWHISSVDSEFDVTMGQSPPGETYNQNGEGLPFYQGRADFTFRFPSRRVYCTAPTRLAKAGDTLVSVRAPVGDINMALENCAIGRGVAAVRHKTKGRSYTYQFMHSLENVFKRFEAEGTVFGAIGKKDFHRISAIVPPKELINGFELLASPMDDRIENMERQNMTLTTLRNTLLSKLISGELRIADVERIVGEHI